MSRKRMVSPEFYTDEKILELPIPARLMFIGIWNHANDEGILKNSPKQLKVQIYPADEEITLNTIIEYVELMVNLKLLTKGTNIDDSPLLKITKWTDHQKINRPTLSRYVFVPLQTNNNSVSDHGAISEESVSDHGGLTEDSRPIEDNIIEVKLKEVNRSKRSKKNPETQTKQDFTFDSVYDIYPVKKSKQASMKAFSRIPKKTMKDFIRALKANIKHWEEEGVDKQFIPHLSTFINQRRWEDEIVPSLAGKPKFKDEMDKQIYERNENMVKETKRMTAYLKHADDVACDEVPDLNEMRGKSNAQPISEAVGQFMSNAQVDTGTDGE